MRFRLALLLAAAGAGAAPAQDFGRDRPAPVAPVTPPAPAPVAAPPAAAPTPPPTVVQQAANTAPPAPVAAPAEPPTAPHPWAVTPAHGAWFVTVKSYVGPTAKQDAEAMATFIRSTYNAAAFLYEWGAEERESQKKARAEVVAMKRKELAGFIQAQEDLRAAAARKGEDFFPARLSVRAPKVTATTQWAVLVGGWPTMDAASDARKLVIRKWDKLPAPRLLDSVVVATPGDGKAGIEGQYLNPFGVSTVVPNPSIKRAQAQELPLDKVVIDMNKDEPLSVLTIKKAWTLTVKDFPIQATTQVNQQEGGIIGKMFNKSDSAAQFDRMAVTAVEFAKTIRSPAMQQAAQQAANRLGMPTVSLDAYVLHLQTGSRVTVGQFDSLEDPALAATQRLLANMAFEIRDTPTGPAKQDLRRMFDGITPMPVPKVK